MNMEKQTCSLEPSKKLKELGVKQESLFWWRRCIPNKGSTYILPEWELSLTKGSISGNELISAFTVAELGEMLPKEFSCRKLDGEYVKWISGFFIDDKITIFTDKNEADSRAKVLIYILENGLMKGMENG